MSIEGWHEIGKATYEGLQEVDRKRARKVYAHGWWYRAKTKTGGRAWYAPDGSEAVAETPAGGVYGMMLLDGGTDNAKEREWLAVLRRMYAAGCRSAMMPTLTSGGMEYWEFDDLAKVWSTLDGAIAFVETNKGAVMGMELWREYRD